jgi:hypothetical protein
MGLFRRRERAPSLDDVQFDASGYELRGEPQPGQQRVWFTPHGDGVGLYVFRIPPDLPRAGSIGDLRDFYARMGPGVIDVALVPAGEMRAAQVVSKTAQQPSGFTYLGALTLAFRDFSYVLKVQCAERGTTGLREAISLDRSLESGATTDPHAVELDAELPDHPLSRTRAVLAHLRTTLSIDPEMRARPPFALAGG